MVRPVAVIAFPATDPDLEPVAAVAEVRRLPWPLDWETLLRSLADAEGVLISNQWRLDERFFSAAPRLRVLSSYGVGYDAIDVEAAIRHGVAVCNTPGVLSGAVADFTLGLILMLARRLLENATYGKGAWARRQPPPPLGWDLAGKTLGIIGMGRIGREVARRARAFGMKVRYYDARGAVGDAEGEFASFEEVLRTADVLSLHVDLNPTTRHLIGARELALMKPTAVLVNTSRGAVVDQPALVEALRAGRLAGAALDVLEEEPPAPGDPLLTLPNVIITPHAASATVETRRAMFELARENLISVLAGREPPACVNPEVLPRALRRG